MTPRMMSFPSLLVGLFLGFAWCATPVHVLANDCECPKVDCGPCGQEESVSFYTEKCAGGARVKSCARPSCVPLDPAPPSCITSGQTAPSGREPASAQALPRPQDATVGAKSVSSESAPVRAVKRVGQVVKVVGSVFVHARTGKEELAKDGTPVFEGTVLKSQAGASAQVRFDNGNEIELGPNSHLDLARIDLPKEDNKQTLLKLIKGQVRNKVQQKYKGAQSYYRVESSGAVAGVRGTDFVVAMNTQGRAEVRVATFDGEVELSDMQSGQQVLIPAGKSASYVIAAHHTSQVFDDREMNEFVARGYLTPVYEMSAAEVADMKKSTRMAERGVPSPATPSSRVCQAPEGELNQCMWTCVNNPKGATRCQSERADVQCMRKRCNANGEWAEESRMPSSLQETCAPQGSRVGPCDY